MIALNELIENYDEFYNKFSYLKREENLKLIIELEDKRKAKQMIFENLRADTNKLCHELALKKKAKEDINAIFNQIIENEKNLKFFDKELNKLNYEINLKLKSLPNLPDQILLSEKVIDSNNSKNASVDDFLKNIKSNNFSVIDLKSYLSTVASSKQILKRFSNYIFEDENVFIEGFKRVVLLLTQKNFDKIFEYILSYLKNNSLLLKHKSTSQIKHSSSDEYFAKLNEIENITIEVKREYYTRLYNIKYKNSDEDMTRFLTEIDIIF